MPILAYILLFTLIGSVISLIGGVLLLLKVELATKLAHYLSSFAAGVLLGTAFFDLLPEALHDAGEINIFAWCLGGFLAFFLFERFIHWFHNHQEGSKEKAVVSMINLGDTIHNFVDGVAIAGTFLVSVPLGIVTTLAVAAHEIPQEIGDFGVMLHKGVKRSKVLMFNLLSSLAALLGAMLAYLAASTIESKLPIILSVAAGFFIYIAAADLIPEIHNQEKRKVAFIETVLLLFGAVLVWFTVSMLEGAH